MMMQSFNDHLEVSEEVQSIMNLRKQAVDENWTGIERLKNTVLQYAGDAKDETIEVDESENVVLNDRDTEKLKDSIKFMER
eukprot:UN01758